MHFLLSSYIPWIAAALLPWLLHLFLFRKADTLYFPSLYFLKQCSGWSTRFKLRQFLLLLTRSALILYLILSFLGPRLEQSASLVGGSAASESALLVLDDRPAMRIKLLARSESLMDVYRAAALADLDRRPASQDIAVAALSELAVPASVRFGSREAAVGKIQSIVTHTLTPPADDYLRTAMDRFKVKILFYSPFRLDFQNPKVARVGPSLPCEPNLTLHSLAAPQTAPLGQPVSVRAAVIDLYGRPADAPVRIRVDETVSGIQTAVNGQAAFLLTQLKAGPHSITAQVMTGGPDGYPDDDVRMAHLDVMQGEGTLFLANSIPRSIRMALSALDVDPLPVPANSKTQYPIHKTFLRKPDGLDGYRRLVVLDASAVDPGVLTGALKRGLDVVIFADAFHPGQDPVRVFPILQMVSMAPDATVVSLNTSALAEAWDQGQASLPISPELNRWIPVVRKFRIVPKSPQDVWMVYDDGSAAMIRSKMDRGSVMVVSFSAEDPALQTDPAFLLMIRGLISTGGTGPTVAPRPTPGSTPFQFKEIALRSDASIPLGPAAPPAAVRLINDRNVTTLSLGYAQGQFFGEIPSPAPPMGLYRFLVGDDPKGEIFLYSAPPPPLDLPAASNGRKRTIPFDDFFFWMAVLLMAVELLLLRQIRTPGHAG